VTSTALAGHPSDAPERTRFQARSFLRAFLRGLTSNVSGKQERSGDETNWPRNSGGIGFLFLARVAPALIEQGESLSHEFRVQHEPGSLDLISEIFIALQAVHRILVIVTWLMLSFDALINLEAERMGLF
jgi:hypothetical protein